jgi:hypothetical protein
MLRPTLCHCLAAPCLLQAFKAVMSNHFDSFMVVVILANVLVMLMVHAGMSETW